MNNKTNYKTKQKNEIIEYLKKMKGKHITVSDICAYFKDNGISVGTTTIYRHIEKMVSEGIIAKYFVDSNTSACFEYIDNENNSKTTCFHCVCEKCGKLIHLHCHEVEHLISHIEGNHNFKINGMRTVFYGLCSDCRNK